MTKFAGELDERPRAHAAVLRRLAAVEMMLGNRRVALAAVASAFRLDPLGVSRALLRNRGLTARILGRFLRSRPSPPMDLAGSGLATERRRHIMPKAADNPRVSVVITTYNRASLLPRAVYSVLAQTYEDYELVIVDDCSTDDTPEVVRTFADSRIRAIRHADNMGQSAAVNTGIRLARGEYIAFLDDDDEWSTRSYSVRWRRSPRLIRELAWCIRGSTMSTRPAACGAPADAVPSQGRLGKLAGLGIPRPHFGVSGPGEGRTRNRRVRRSSDNSHRPGLSDSPVQAVARCRGQRSPHADARRAARPNGTAAWSARRYRQVSQVPHMQIRTRAGRTPRDFRSAPEDTGHRGNETWQRARRGGGVLQSAHRGRAGYAESYPWERRLHRRAAVGTYPTRPWMNPSMGPRGSRMSQVDPERVPVRVAHVIGHIARGLGTRRTTSHTSRPWRARRSRS